MTTNTFSLPPFVAGSFAETEASTKGTNSTDYIDGRRRRGRYLAKRGKPLLGTSFGLPLAEARGLLPLVWRGVLTVDQARQLIGISERDRRALLAAGVYPHVVQKAAEFRRDVLAAFEAENECEAALRAAEAELAEEHLAESKPLALRPCAKTTLVPFSRRRRPVKIFDRLRQRTQEHPEDGPGKSAQDVIGETGGVCVECFRRVAVRALDDRALCAYCYRVEVNAQSR